MQQILNSKERTQTFLKFLLFFLVTIILVVTAVYFNFRVPVKENAWLQNQLENMQKQDADQSKFVSKMEQAVILLDTLDKKNATNSDLTQKTLGNLIGDMQINQQNSKALYSKMNKAIVEQFDKLRVAKGELINSTGDADRVEKLQRELDQTKRDLDAYRKAPASNGFSPN